MPHTMLSVAKNLGTRNNNIGSKVHAHTDHAINPIHIATKILEDSLHFHCSLSGIASRITLVLMPSACCMISTYNDLCSVKKAEPGTNISKNPNRLGFANINVIEEVVQSS
jgi:hypothetical protein